VNRLRFCTLSTVYVEDLQKPRFDGKTIEGFGELVKHLENQQERFRQPSSDATEDHGSPNPSEEEKRVP